mmetsp:Transcript_6620/g.17815  ORF Transcript_6620/g.17815 Transcript_6620/m.17815 type:complete len:213 (+) Transcript_6620:84-722(+)|eukprot:CAMPEP_0185840196 /NCGR_PEP_ID=MMETSP1353-20130828/15831_1 /TAXON_ID=1077150 /ORGANISM="Erythrolobus australicus, Strain CCMP3124" /LENGTH=212 /DNA_ID=CAMNT_0028539489 /DNA_START=67 /DNA_END=705 /DNA_ORIENTATION=+
MSEDASAAEERAAGMGAAIRDGSAEDGATEKPGVATRIGAEKPPLLPRASGSKKFYQFAEIARPSQQHAAASKSFRRASSGSMELAASNEFEIGEVPSFVRNECGVAQTTRFAGTSYKIATKQPQTSNWPAKPSPAALVASLRSKQSFTSVHRDMMMAPSPLPNMAAHRSKNSASSTSWIPVSFRPRRRLGTSLLTPIPEEQELASSSESPF